jgi:hypothetical protein
MDCFNGQDIYAARIVSLTELYCMLIAGERVLSTKSIAWQSLQSGSHHEQSKTSGPTQELVK